MQDDNATARLSDATIQRLGKHVRVPGYDRGATRIGIVHLGAGAFHRAHQAVYIDTLLEHDPHWAICAVSLNSPATRDALRPQDGLYTLNVLDDTAGLRVIGAIREVLYAVEEGDAVLARLVDPEVRLVTLTITEKGYCLAGDALDLLHPDIVHDLRNPARPRSAVGYLAAALAGRHAAGIPAFTVLSCDNLADNGGVLRRAVLQFVQQQDPVLADWIHRCVAFPRCMVDSITPSTDDALRQRVQQRLGLVDTWPVQREPYTHWVIEAMDATGGIPWHALGATLSTDVAAHERAKLRLLNAAHSAMAYLGSLLGLETVAEAMEHPVLSRYIVTLMDASIAPSAELPTDLDVGCYIDAILQRFSNPHVQHRLEQIAQDGSLKIPIRFFGTISNALQSKRPIHAVCLPIAAWLLYVQRQVAAGAVLQDPRSGALHPAAQACTGEAAHDVPLLLDAAGLLDASGGDELLAGIQHVYRSLGTGCPRDVELAMDAVVQARSPG